MTAMKKLISVKRFLRIKKKNDFWLALSRVMHLKKLKNPALRHVQ